MIAACAVKAALCWIGQNATFVHRRRANFLGNALGWIEGRARRLVAHDFYADEQTEPADVADVRMAKKRRESVAQRYSSGSDAREKIVRLDVIEYGVAGSSCNRMGLVSKSMLEVSGAFFKCFDDIGSDENGAKRSVAARNPLSCKNNVRLEPPVLHSKRLAGASNPAHNLIGDEKNAALAANLGDAHNVTFRRDNRAESCSDNRLEDKSSRGVCVVFGKNRI